MEKLKLGIIGLGARGYWLIENLFTYMDEIQITAVCDVYADRVEKAQNKIAEKYEKPFGTTDYNMVLDKNLVDCAVVITSWASHVKAAVACMEAGIPCGLEVGGAQTLEECYELIETYEKTKTPFMFLENCCYGRRELMVLNMVQKGVFGEIVACSGGYMHDLREEIAFGKENRHYRLEEYSRRNCENYPTHELGPIAMVLGINRGNRMVSLTSTASKAVGLHEFITEKKPDDSGLAERSFKQGDVVTTVIKCEKGETITLKLDTTLPRYYSRGFCVQGTKGMYNEENDSVFIDGAPDHWNWKKHWGNAEEYQEEYDHEIWKKYLSEGVKPGHDGIDYLVYGDFFRHVKSGEHMPIDVYDAAVWMSISPLSEKSIALGGAPVEIPDFKNLK